MLAYSKAFTIFTRMGMFYVQALVFALCLVPMGFGIFISMRIFKIPDITTDGSYTFGAALSSVLLISGMNPWLLLPVIFSSGFVAGGLTGFIHARLGVNALLAGILVMSALYSVNLAIMGRSNVPLIGVNTLFHDGNSETLLTTSLVTLMLFALLLGTALTLLLKTDFGIAMRATGANETMSRMMGVNTNRMKIIGLGLANGCTALSGFLVCQQQGFADINMGIGIVILGLGAVMIGEVFLKRNPSPALIVRLVTVVAGTLLFRFALASILIAGMDPNWLKAATAALVLLMISVPLGRKTT